MGGEDQGNEIREYKGIITGAAIARFNPSSMEKSVYKAQEKAIKEMKNKARRINANAIIAIDFEHVLLKEENTNCAMMINVSGTAVGI